MAASLNWWEDEEQLALQEAQISGESEEPQVEEPRPTDASLSLAAPVAAPILTPQRQTPAADLSADLNWWEDEEQIDAASRELEELGVITVPAGSMRPDIDRGLVGEGVAGAQRGMAQTVGMLYGFTGMLAEGLGMEPTADWANKKALEKLEDARQFAASIEDPFEEIEDASDTLKFAVGAMTQFIPDAAVSLLAGGVAGLGARAAVGSAVKSAVQGKLAQRLATNLVTRQVERRVAAGATRAAAEKAVADQVTKRFLKQGLADSTIKRSALGGAYAVNYAQNAGDISTGILQQTGETSPGIAALAAAPNAALDTIFDAVVGGPILGKLVPGARAPKIAPGTALADITVGPQTRLGRVAQTAQTMATTGLVGGVVEGVTEGAQTFGEQIARGLADPRTTPMEAVSSEEAARERNIAAATGFAGGLGLGGAGGIVQSQFTQRTQRALQTKLRMEQAEAQVRAAEQERLTKLGEGWDDPVDIGNGVLVARRNDGSFAAFNLPEDQAQGLQPAVLPNGQKIHIFVDDFELGLSPGNAASSLANLARQAYGKRAPVVGGQAEFDFMAGLPKEEGDGDYNPPTDEEGATPPGGTPPGPGDGQGEFDFTTPPPAGPAAQNISSPGTSGQRSGPVAAGSVISPAPESNQEEILPLASMGERGYLPTVEAIGLAKKKVSAEEFRAKLNEVLNDPSQRMISIEGDNAELQQSYAIETTARQILEADRLKNGPIRIAPAPAAPSVKGELDPETRDTKQAARAKETLKRPAETAAPFVEGLNKGDRVSVVMPNPRNRKTTLVPGIFAERLENGDSIFQLEDGQTVQIPKTQSNRVSMLRPEDVKPAKPVAKVIKDQLGPAPTKAKIEQTFGVSNYTPGQTLKQTIADGNGDSPIPVLARLLKKKGTENDYLVENEGEFTNDPLTSVRQMNAGLPIYLPENQDLNLLSPDIEVTPVEVNGVTRNKVSAVNLWGRTYRQGAEASDFSVSRGPESGLSESQTRGLGIFNPIYRLSPERLRRSAAGMQAARTRQQGTKMKPEEMNKGLENLDPVDRLILEDSATRAINYINRKSSTKGQATTEDVQDAARFAATDEIMTGLVKAAAARNEKLPATSAPVARRVLNNFNEILGQPLPAGEERDAKSDAKKAGDLVVGELQNEGMAEAEARAAVDPIVRRIAMIQSPISIAEAALKSATKTAIRSEANQAAATADLQEGTVGETPTVKKPRKSARPLNAKESAKIETMTQRRDRLSEEDLDLITADISGEELTGIDAARVEQIKEYLDGNTEYETLYPQRPDNADAARGQTSGRTVSGTTESRARGSSGGRKKGRAVGVGRANDGESGTVPGAAAQQAGGSGVRDTAGLTPAEQRSRALGARRFLVERFLRLTGAEIAAATEAQINRVYEAITTILSPEAANQGRRVVAFTEGQQVADLANTRPEDLLAAVGAERTAGQKTRRRTEMVRRLAAEMFRAGAFESTTDLLEFIANNKSLPRDMQLRAKAALGLQTRGFNWSNIATQIGIFRNMDGSRTTWAGLLGKDRDGGKSIAINLDNGHDRGTAYQTFLHEIQHVLNDAKWDAYYGLPGGQGLKLNRVELAAIKRVEDFWKRAVLAAAKQFGIDTPANPTDAEFTQLGEQIYDLSDPTREDIRPDRRLAALRNPRELSVEITSSPDTAELLAELGFGKADKDGKVAIKGAVKEAWDALVQLESGTIADPDSPLAMAFKASMAINFAGTGDKKVDSRYTVPDSAPSRLTRELDEMRTASDFVEAELEARGLPGTSEQRAQIVREYELTRREPTQEDLDGIADPETMSRAVDPSDLIQIGMRVRVTARDANGTRFNFFARPGTDSTMMGAPVRVFQETDKDGATVNRTRVVQADLIENEQPLAMSKTYGEWVPVPSTSLESRAIVDSWQRAVDQNRLGAVEFERLTADEIPQSTQEVYKLVVLQPTKPMQAQSLFDRPENAPKKAFPVGEWIRAEVGRPMISGPLAMRPGFHAIGLPIFDQGRVQAKGQMRVWASVTMPAFTDSTQQEADSSPILANGMRQGIKDRLIGPDEAYNYKTNPNAEEGGTWPISGSMKINRFLTNTEITEILTSAGKEDAVANNISNFTDDQVEQINRMVVRATESRAISSNESQPALSNQGATNDRRNEPALQTSAEGMGSQGRGDQVQRQTLRPNAEPNPFVQDGVSTYNARYGLGEVVRGHYAPVDEQRARQIAAAYDALPVLDPGAATQEAYGQLAAEIQQQWDYAINDMGITFEPWTQEGQPYANSREMVRDVRDNRHLWFFTGGEPHPLLNQPDADGLTMNDKLRAIHDLFGHAAEDYQFGARGEENAWIKHSQMFTPLAQRALTTETRGQNSWVNYGAHNYGPDGARIKIPASERPFATQKMALLPEEYMDWQGALAQSPTESRALALREQTVLPGTIAATIREAGGITVDIWTGDQPDSGYIVAPFKETETQISLNTFGPEAVRSFIRRFRDLLAVRGMHLGGWLSGSTVYLDASIVTNDQVLATLIAQDGNQLAVFDRANFTELATDELSRRFSEALGRSRQGSEYQALARALRETRDRILGGIRGAGDSDVPGQGALQERTGLADENITASRAVPGDEIPFIYLQRGLDRGNSARGPESLRSVTTATQDDNRRETGASAAQRNRVAVFERFVDYADLNNLRMPAAMFRRFIDKKKELSAGAEHTVYDEPTTDRVIKVTHPDLIQDGTVGAKGSAFDYFSSLLLSREFLGMDTKFEGIVDLRDGSAPRVITSQPHIKGKYATDKRIAQELRKLGFSQDNDSIWSHPIGLKIYDAVGKNVIVDDEGTLHWIDVDLIPTRPLNEVLAAIAAGKSQLATESRAVGPIESAKALVDQLGREAIKDEETFFNQVWPQLLNRTGRQLTLSPRNFREAARRAISDLEGFLRENPKFADYYNKDWELTRTILADFLGRPITDDEFLMFRALSGLNSPNTMLPSNMGDAVNFFDLWVNTGNFDAIKLGPKPGTGTIVVLGSPFEISGTTQNIKARSIKAVEGLVKRFGTVKEAVDFLQEPVTVQQLHSFNREMGYKGNVSNIGNIRSLVKQATGQDTLIPRMFIFGQKVGAYTLNALGDSRYTTVDIWESRFIRSYFKGMFEQNTGLPVDNSEHDVFTRFNEVFKEEFEKSTGLKWEASALQAVRWFYIIDSAKRAGYSKASTNETISFYTERKLRDSYGYTGLGGIDPQGGTAGDGTGRAGVEGGADTAAQGDPGRVESRAVSPQQDADYLAAVVRGDMETAQRMVDEAARRAGYVRKVYHGTEDGEFTTFDPEQTSKKTGYVYFSTDRGTAQSYSGARRALRAGERGRGILDIYVKDPDVVADFEEAAWNGQKPDGTTNEYYDSGGIDGIARDGKMFGWDSFEVQNVLDEGPNGDTAWYASTIAVADPTFIKSADAVVRDDQANVIPLSERFNEASPDIRFSRAVRDPDDEDLAAAEVLNNGRPVDTYGLPRGARASNTTPQGDLDIADAQIDSTTRSLVKLVGAFESATDKLRRGTGLNKLADYIDNYFDLYEQRLGLANGLLRRARVKMGMGSDEEAVRTFESYMRARENKRAADAKKIYDQATEAQRAYIDAWNDYSKQTGVINTQIRTPDGKPMQVYDTKLKKWRPIQTVRDFFPRTMRQEVQAVLQNPALDPALYNDLLDALVAEKKANSREQAQEYLKREYFGTDTSQDYFAGVERGRREPLPEIFYDYSVDAIRRYMKKWAQRTAQIEAFGQATSQGTGDWFDNNITKVRDPNTRRYLNQIKERIYEVKEDDAFGSMMNWLNVGATGLQLGNPATAFINLFGGSGLTVTEYGWKNTIKAAKDVFSDWKNVMQSGADLGIVGKDLLNVLNDADMEGSKYFTEQSTVSQALAKFASFTMKWGGYSGAENFVRATTMLAARGKLMEGLRANNTNPSSSKARWLFDFAKRENLDANKLVMENGAGPETGKFLRKAVNVPQGSYRIDMTPIYVDQPLGRFLFKYQKFGTQLTRMFWRHHLQPFIEKPDLANFSKLLHFFSAAIASGTVIVAGRAALFGYPDPGPDEEDLKRALANKDTARAWGLIFSRAWHSMNAAGALGFFGNYFQFVLDWRDQQRVKNPLKPPGLASIDAVVEVLSRLREQGKLTGKDLDEIAESTIALYRANKRIGLSSLDAVGIEFNQVKEWAAEKQIRRMRKYSRMYADDREIEGRQRSPDGRISKTPMSPLNRDITLALRRGDAAQAKLIMDTALKGAATKEEREAMMGSIQSSVRFRQPLSISGRPPSSEERADFFNWARRNAPPHRYESMRKMDEEYRRAAARLGVSIK